MKTIVDSCTEQTRFVRYPHLNSQKRLFGGALLQWIDEMAGIVAFRHTGGEVTTAAIDTLVFKEPAFLGDLLAMTGQITYIGKTSMEVRVDTYVESSRGQQQLINRAYLVMVALDEEGKPTQIPPVKLCSADEEAEWTAGEKRYALRKARRKEQY